MLWLNVVTVVCAIEQLVNANAMWGSKVVDVVDYLAQTNAVDTESVITLKFTRKTRIINALGVIPPSIIPAGMLRKSWDVPAMEDGLDTIVHCVHVPREMTP